MKIYDFNLKKLIKILKNIFKKVAQISIKFNLKIMI